MRRIILIALALLGLSSAAMAADSNVPGMTAAGALTDTDLMYCGQSAGTLDRKCTPLQLSTYIFGKVSGDLTCTGPGVCTVTKTNGTAFGALATVTPGTGVATAAAVNVGTAGSVVVNGGALGTPSSGTLTSATGLPISTGVSGLGTGIATWLATPSSANLLAALTTKTGTGNAVFGSAPTIDSLNATTAATLAFITGSTQCLQVNTSGVISGTGAVCGGSGSSGANPTATASDTAVNGVATTFMRSDAAPAVQKTSASVFGLAKVDGTTIIAASGVITAVPGVTSRTVTSGPDTILAADRGNIVYYNSASSIAISQPAPSGSFAAGFFTTVCQINNGIPTVTPGSGTIGGAGTLALPAGGTAANPICTSYQSDGTNFNLIPSWMVNASLLTAGTIPSARLGFGTNVFTAAANTLSSAGGLTSTIASGTAALGTTLIASAACATVVTAAATNVATTDVLAASFNGDPTAVTGYAPSASGMLAIIGYPTAGNVNFKVCNNTSAGITPGAITLNWRVTR